MVTMEDVKAKGLVLDDENKILWCNQAIVDWKETFRYSTRITIDGKIEMLYLVSRVGWGHGLDDSDYHSVDYEHWGGGNENKIKLITAVLHDYEFKVPEEVKYYWRKKAKYTAYKVEDAYKGYLNRRLDGNLLLNTKEHSFSHETRFTATEAQELLGEDFCKFESEEIK